jgi:hypothetical protein
MHVATAEWELEARLVTHQAVWPNLLTHDRSITDKQRMFLWTPAKRLARHSHSLGKRSTCAGSAHCQVHPTFYTPHPTPRRKAWFGRISGVNALDTMI